MVAFADAELVTVALPFAAKVPKLTVSNPGLTAVIVAAPMVPIPAEVKVSPQPLVLEDSVGVPVIAPPPVTRANPFGTSTVPAIVIVPVLEVLPI